MSPAARLAGLMSPDEPGWRVRRQPRLRSGAEPHATAEQVEAAPPGHQTRPGALSRLGGGVLRRQVVDLLRPALHRLRAGSVRRDSARRGAARTALRARARTGLRHRLLPAQPDPGAGWPGAGRSPTCRRGWSRSRLRNGLSLGWTSMAASPTPRGSRTTTTPSTWSSGTRCCTTSPTSNCRCARSCACSSRAAGSSSPVSPRPSATSTRAAGRR